MNNQNKNNFEQEFQRIEKELEEREYAIRLRELEAEIDRKNGSQEAPYYETQKVKTKQSALKRQFNNFVTLAKFTGFVIVGFAIVYVGLQVGMILTYGLIATVVGLIGYKLFLEKGHSK